MLLQFKTYLLTTLIDKSFSSYFGASSVNIDEIKLAITSVQPAQVQLQTVKMFCEAMRLLSTWWWGKPSEWDKIHSAGGIPVLVQLLARFPDSKEVVHSVSMAIHNIAFWGSAAAKAELLWQPGIIALLETASAKFEATPVEARVPPSSIPVWFPASFRTPIDVAALALKRLRM